MDGKITKNQTPLKASEVTIDTVLSHYYGNSSNSSEPTKRTPTDNNNTTRSPIVIDAVDIMKNGWGRYASAIDFGMFRKFFDQKGLPAGSYNFEQMGYKIYGKDKFDALNQSFQDTNKGFNADISQYTRDINSSDYVERAFIFGSTKVTVTPEHLKNLVFKVNPDGTKVIENLVISPVNDNFDFEGGNDANKMVIVDKANAFFKSTLDPEGIGRKVPLEFANVENLKSVPTQKRKV